MSVVQMPVEWQSTTKSIRKKIGKRRETREERGRTGHKSRKVALARCTGCTGRNKSSGARPDADAKHWTRANFLLML